MELIPTTFFCFDNLVISQQFKISYRVYTSEIILCTYNFCILSNLSELMVFYITYTRSDFVGKNKMIKHRIN